MDKHKEKFLDFVEKQIKSLQKRVLDLSEVVVPQDNYIQFRSKILGSTNDLLRDIESELETNYNLKYEPSVIREDVVQIKPSPRLATTKLAAPEIASRREDGKLGTGK